MNYLCKLFIFCLVFAANAQEIKKTLSPYKFESSNFEIQSFSYPVFLNNETHSSFIVNYKFDKRFRAELQGFYDSYLPGDIYGLSLSLEYYANDKIYFFSGMGARVIRSNQRGSKSIPQFFMINGMGYDINKKLNLETKYEFQTNKGDFGNFIPSNLFSVNGKYKF